MEWPGGQAKMTGATLIHTPDTTLATLDQGVGRQTDQDTTPLRAILDGRMLPGFRRRFRTRISPGTPWRVGRLDARITDDDLLGSILGLTVELEHRAEQIEQLQRSIAELVDLVALPVFMVGPQP